MIHDESMDDTMRDTLKDLTQEEMEAIDGGCHWACYYVYYPVRVFYYPVPRSPCYAYWGCY